MAEDIMQMALLAKALGGSGTKNNLSTLFGLDPNILAAQQAQQQLQGSRQEAMQYAQLDPYQRANYMMYQGGSGLTGGLMGAIGPETAAVARAKKIADFKQILSASDINMNTAEGQLKASELAKGMGLADLGIELTNNAFAMSKTQAETQKALQPGTETERYQSFLVGLNDAIAQGKPVAPAAIQQAALINQAMTEPKVMMGPDGTMIMRTPESPLNKLPALSKVLQTQYTQQSQGAQQVPTAPKGQPNAPQQGAPQQIAPGVTVSQVVPPKLEASVRKEVADTDSLIRSADQTARGIENLSKKVATLDVSLARNTGRAIESQLGLSSKEQLIVDEMKRFIETNRNTILNQATGVQAKDDAERILNQVFGDETIWRNPARLQAAWSSLVDLSKNTAEGLRTKRQALVPEGANIGAAPQAPQAAPKPKTSRADAFAAMRKANPNASDASINKWLEERGY